MGGSGSTRRVSFEADDNDQITVVKGIRLSDNVISRMRDASPTVDKPQASPRPPPSDSRSAVSASPIATDEEIRKQITEEIVQERARQESNLQKRLDQNKQFVHDEIGKIMERERATANDSLVKTVLRERALTEEERTNAKRTDLERKAKKLEEKEKELQKMDSYYKDQVARLEDMSAKFYQLNADQYQKAADEVEAKFKRYESRPICADLQEGILRCYQKNPQQTLSCSALAKQYVHCINYAKQSLLGKGG
eukprot:gi/632947393/ref/XP_007889023.1/ PREDICTED: coiled-coil-helix-coiled-coil-helix domain-containing protein 3, mitochondrial isoform X2 [Callorhinchus milii]